MDRRSGRAGRKRTVPDDRLCGRADADVHHPAGAVQLGLQLDPGVARGGPLHGGGADRDAGHGTGVLDHHDRHGDRGAGGHRGEQQHRADRHLSGIQRLHAP